MEKITDRCGVTADMGIDRLQNVIGVRPVVHHIHHGYLPVSLVDVAIFRPCDSAKLDPSKIEFSPLDGEKIERFDT